MKIYDISQEILNCKVYPGDPKPNKQIISSILKGDLYNLSSFSMCAHNGTHIDSPYHFYEKGKTIDQISLDKVIGFAYVIFCDEEITLDTMKKIYTKALENSAEAAKRILIKGKGYINKDAAEYLAKQNIYLIGSESQTIGPLDTPMDVHLLLLNKDIVLLEGINLNDINEGIYFLNAAPLNISGFDGSPCRAVLIDFNK